MSEESIYSNESERPTAIDLFSGCGGLTLGLKSAGFQVLAAVEIDSKAQDTYSLNHPEVELYRDDIRGLDATFALSLLGLKRGELDLLAGCPPCQGFSRLRTRNKAVSVSDTRNDLINEFTRFVEAALPLAVMLENVPALANDGRFHRFIAELRALGYSASWAIVDAAQYGVAQRRRRLILLASRVHRPEIAAPVGEQKTVRQVLAGLLPPAKSKDALHRFPENRSAAVRQLIARIPKDGGSRRQLGAKYQLACHTRRAGFYDVYGRMAWDAVAPTITSGCHNPSKGRFLHPTENRTITLREASILQGFPQNYYFNVAHGKEAIALMIGNALPPPLIQAQAAGLYSGILASRQ